MNIHASNALKFPSEESWDRMVNYTKSYYTRSVKNFYPGCQLGVDKYVVFRFLKQPLRFSSLPFYSLPRAQIPELLWGVWQNNTQVWIITMPVFSIVVNTRITLMTVILWQYHSGRGICNPQSLTRPCPQIFREYQPAYTGLWSRFFQSYTPGF